MGRRRKVKRKSTGQDYRIELLMAEQTGISWTDATWNPWHGCTKVSPGCKHCYMYREKKRYRKDPAKCVRSKTTFKDPLKWKSPKRIFTCSWSDFFIDTADPWRGEAWDIIRATPQHTYQILTKRPERILAHLPADWGKGWPHVWLGVSLESMEYVTRIHELLRVPAFTRFISAEPLLEELDILLELDSQTCNACGAYQFNRGACDACGCRVSRRGIHQVIVGGESGPEYRVMDPRWATKLREDCELMGVPFFFKQMGGADKDKGGNELDGRTWEQMPKGEIASSLEGAPRNDR